MLPTVVIEGVEYEILPLDNLSSPLCGTSTGALRCMTTLEEEERGARVAKAKHARSCVKRPFGKPAVTSGQ